MGQYCFARWRL